MLRTPYKVTCCKTSLSQAQAKRATCTDFLQKEEPFTTFCNYLNLRQPDLMQEGFDSLVVKRATDLRFAANVAKHVSLSTKFEYYKKVVTQISQLPRNLHCLSPRTAPPPKFFWWDCVTCQRTSRPQLTQRVRAWIQHVW